MENKIQTEKTTTINSQRMVVEDWRVFNVLAHRLNCSTDKLLSVTDFRATLFRVHGNYLKRLKVADDEAVLAMQIALSNKTVCYSVTDFSAEKITGKGICEEVNCMMFKFENFEKVKTDSEEKLQTSHHSFGLQFTDDVDTGIDMFWVHHVVAHLQLNIELHTLKTGNVVISIDCSDNCQNHESEIKILVFEKSYKKKAMQIYDFYRKLSRNEFTNASLNDLETQFVAKNVKCISVKLENVFLGYAERLSNEWSHSVRATESGMGADYYSVIVPDMGKDKIAPFLLNCVGNSINWGSTVNNFQCGLMVNTFDSLKSDSLNTAMKELTHDRTTTLLDFDFTEEISWKSTDLDKAIIEITFKRATEKYLINSQMKEEHIDYTRIASKVPSFKILLQPGDHVELMAATILDVHLVQKNKDDWDFYTKNMDYIASNCEATDPKKKSLQTAAILTFMTNCNRKLGGGNYGLQKTTLVFIGEDYVTNKAKEIFSKLRNFCARNSKPEESDCDFIVSNPANYLRTWFNKNEFKNQGVRGKQIANSYVDLYDDFHQMLEGHEIFFKSGKESDECPMKYNVKSNMRIYPENFQGVDFGCNYALGFGSEDDPVKALQMLSIEDPVKLEKINETARAIQKDRKIEAAKSITPERETELLAEIKRLKHQILSVESRFEAELTGFKNKETKHADVKINFEKQLSQIQAKMNKASKQSKITDDQIVGLKKINVALIAEKAVLNSEIRDLKYQLEHGQNDSDEKSSENNNSKETSKEISYLRTKNVELEDLLAVTRTNSYEVVKIRDDEDKRRIFELEKDNEKLRAAARVSKKEHRINKSKIAEQK